MTNPSPERTEAIQAVLDRITSWQDTAPDSTEDKELRKGLEKAGLELSDEEISQLEQALETTDGPVHASDVLG